VSCPVRQLMDLDRVHFEICYSHHSSFNRKPFVYQEPITNFETTENSVTPGGFEA